VRSPERAEAGEVETAADLKRQESQQEHVLVLKFEAKGLVSTTLTHMRQYSYRGGEGAGGSKTYHGENGNGEGRHGKGENDEGDGLELHATLDQHGEDGAADHDAHLCAHIQITRGEGVEHSENVTVHGQR